MKKLVIIWLLCANVLLVQGQAQKFRQTVELEIDPLAYLMKGYSLHGILNGNQMRFDMGVYSITTPGKMTGNPGFTVVSSGFGIKLNYMIKRVNGFYTGGDMGFGKILAKDDEAGLHDFGHNISIGAHAGFRYFPFLNYEGVWRKFYITPWAGVSYKYNFDEVQMRGYREQKLGYFAAIHLGVRL